MREAVKAKPNGDRRVPIAVVATLMAHSAAVFLWVGSAGERLAQLERRVMTQSEMQVRTARLEEQIVHVRQALERIERKLDKRLDADAD